MTNAEIRAAEARLRRAWSEQLRKGRYVIGMGNMARYTRPSTRWALQLLAMAEGCLWDIGLVVCDDGAEGIRLELCSAGLAESLAPLLREHVRRYSRPQSGPVPPPPGPSRYEGVLRG